MATKQHEILAVKNGILGKVNKLIADLTATFTSKQHLFTKKVVVFASNAEGVAPVTEENLALNTTVPKELGWVAKEFGKLLDACHKINCTNTVAKADVMIDGKPLLRDVPATGLLELEKHVTSFKALIATVPTLDPTKAFVADGNEGSGVYKAREVVKSRTAKEKAVITLSPATDKFAANVQMYDKDVVTGTIRQNEWSGMITPAQKSELLDRCEDLVNAIKEAMARANNIDVVGDKIGDPVTGYILGDLVK